MQELREQNRQLADQLDALAESIETGASSSREASRLHLGGYGELHYNNLSNSLEGGEDLREIDFHRFVLYLGYDFSDSIRFNSELEVEHSLAGDGAPGEVALEQAYVEFDLSDRQRARAGILLVPLGFINETHEPPTFYGVERNPIAKYIIPTTWGEGGVALTGNTGGAFDYDAVIHSGLDLAADSDYAIRKGRQKVAEAKAEGFAFTGRIRWTPVTGLRLAVATQYQADPTQSAEEDVSALLLETDLQWNSGPWQLRALYADWTLEGDGPEAAGADRQYGWYVEPSWRPDERWGLFIRFNEWDNAAGDGSDSLMRQTNAGINWWPHPDVVVKADIQSQQSPAGRNEFSGFNLGIGYQF